MNEVKHILKLAWPLLLTQITASLMFFTDTVMASRASHIDMASVSIATGLWSPIAFSVQGLLIAVTPVVAHLLGNKNNKNNLQVANTLYQGGYLALLVCLLVVFIFQFLHLPLNYLNLEPELHEKSSGYLNYVIWGILPSCVFFVLRSFCEGLALTKPALIVSIVALIANIPLNYMFVFGKFGAPELGGAGCGLATAIVQWIALFGLLVYFAVSSKLASFKLGSGQKKPSRLQITALAKIGIPIAFSLLFETTLFAFMAIFIAPLGALALAGHQVAFSYSSVVFMLPLSLAMAATIRVGYAKGSGDIHKLKQTIKTCLAMATIAGFAIMLFTLFGRYLIISIYTHEQEVINLAASILVITAMYQLPDAIQAMCAGIFKGLKKTKPLFYITFISYWPIGFLLGYVLARTDIITSAMGPQGFWVGTVIGLSTASILFLIRMKKEVSAIHSD